MYLLRCSYLAPYVHTINCHKYFLFYKIRLLIYGVLSLNLWTTWKIKATFVHLFARDWWTVLTMKVCMYKNRVENDKIFVWNTVSFILQAKKYSIKWSHKIQNKIYIYIMVELKYPPSGFQIFFYCFYPIFLLLIFPSGHHFIPY